MRKFASIHCVMRIISIRAPSNHAGRFIERAKSIILLPTTNVEKQADPTQSMGFDFSPSHRIT